MCTCVCVCVCVCVEGGRCQDVDVYIYVYSSSRPLHAETPLSCPPGLRPSVTSDGTAMKLTSSSSKKKFRPHPILAKAHHFRLKFFVRSCMMIHQQLSICG